MVSLDTEHGTAGECSSSDFLRHGAAADVGGRATQEDAHWALLSQNRPHLGAWRGFYVVS